MTDWGYKQEWSVSFDLPVEEKMKEFIDKMDKEHKDVEDVFNARIKKLFEEYIELDGAASLGYDKFLALFRSGYELGWNDRSDILKDKEDGIIDKTCDWLERNGIYYIGFEQGQPCITEEFIKSLKKYLEEQV